MIFRLHEVLPKKLSTIFGWYEVLPKNKLSTIFRLHEVLPKNLSTIIIIYSGYPLHRSVFQWGPAKIMYNTVTIQYNAIRYDTREASSYQNTRLRWAIRYRPVLHASPTIVIFDFKRKLVVNSDACADIFPRCCQDGVLMATMRCAKRHARGLRLHTCRHRVRLWHKIIRYRMRAPSRDRGPIWQKNLPLKITVCFCTKCPGAS